MSLSAFPKPYDNSKCDHFLMKKKTASLAEKQLQISMYSMEDQSLKKLNFLNEISVRIYY